MYLKLQFRLPIISFIIFGIGILGFVFGVIALKRKDRSIFALISIIVGILIIIWIAAELFFPH